MSSVTPLEDLASLRAGPARVPVDVALPLRTTDFDAGLAGLLHRALNGEARRDVLNGLCQHLARLLRLRLAVLVRRVDSGTTAIEAASTENALWLELQHIPERWDDGVSSQGPAGQALRAQAPIRMRPADEAFALWRGGAEAERVREILALPLETDEGPRVLELYFDGDIARGATVGTLSIGQLSRTVAAFLTDLAKIEQQQLLAATLASAGNATFITDLQGEIVWSNEAFSALSGYSAEEARGRNPNFLRSGEQGTRYYRELWGTIRAGKTWSGETVDRSKDGRTYKIHQTVSPVVRNGRITHYASIHEDIGKQEKERVQLELATRLHPRTGLLTPAAFEEDLRQALASAAAQPLALVILSLRGLQRAAPSLGEEMENLVASALGQRLRRGLHENELGGMAGAFEYVLLLRGDVTPAGLQARLATLCEMLNEPLPYLGALPNFDIHAGMAMFPDEGTSFQELRLKADRHLADEPYRRAHRDATH